MFHIRDSVPFSCSGFGEKGGHKMASFFSFFKKDRHHKSRCHVVKM